MQQEVIAVYDIGKTNKKIILFNDKLEVVYEQEKVFEEITDDDGFGCDDIEKIENWIKKSLNELSISKKFQIKGVNFCTYGASLVYLDKEGNRIGPVYNYLKPMPDDVLDDFYVQWGGKEQFSRVTASPAMGMLNSGLQILWLKKKKSLVYNRVKSILHFPQYLSYLFTGKIISEYTSIGCHTAMWDFDHNQYHPWLQSENIHLPAPVSNKVTWPTFLNGKEIHVGSGLHDSSSSLVPYFSGSVPFILVSTGTWCILMNPFNAEPLTFDQLRKDTLCYMSINQKQVKSSRLFMGHMHDINLKRITTHFNCAPHFYKTIRYNPGLMDQIKSRFKGSKVFFKNGIPDDYLDREVNPEMFTSFEQAYHVLMSDLTQLVLESLELITPAKDNTKALYLCGGFTHNDIFIHLLPKWLPDKNVIPSQINNATALGAALVIWEKVFLKDAPKNIIKNTI